MEPEETNDNVETENTTQKSTLLVEQSDIDKVFSFPVFEQIENVDKNTSDLLVEVKKLNEFLIPTEEELEEQKQLEAQQLQEAEEVSVEEEPVEEEVVEEEPTEIPIDYDPLILEQLEILNSHMEESLQIQNDTKIISAESSFLLVGTIVIAIAIKVMVDQITKW